MTGTVLFDLIVADPPWRYEHSRTKSRRVENQYPTMLLADICALPVSHLAASSSVLMLWATAPKLEDALTVMRAWGFTYRTNAAWDKERIGMGYYFRTQHEHLLLGVRGKPATPLPANRPRSVFRAKSKRHSAKPDPVMDALERMYPSARKLDLFARVERAGWSHWGSDLPPSISLGDYLTASA